MTIAAPEKLSDAAFWQERKQHWISEGIDPIIAGELAWMNLAGYTTTSETVDEAMASERRTRSTQAKPFDDSDLEKIGFGFTTPPEPTWDETCGIPPWPMGSQWPAGTAYCPRCWKWWTGFRTQHCSVCHQTFSGETTGDAHRTGPYDPPGQRRCLTPTELEGLGLWVEDRGVWHGSPNKKGIQKHRPPRDKD